MKKDIINTLIKNSMKDLDPNNESDRKLLFRKALDDLDEKAKKEKVNKRK